VHPGDGKFVQGHGDHQLLGAVLYLMCDDLKVEMQRLKKKHVEYSGVVKAEWGNSITLRLPSGGEIGLYQPAHQTAI